MGIHPPHNWPGTKHGLHGQRDIWSYGSRICCGLLWWQSFAVARKNLKNSDLASVHLHYFNGSMFCSSKSRADGTPPDNVTWFLYCFGVSPGFCNSTIPGGRGPRSHQTFSLIKTKCTQRTRNCLTQQGPNVWSCKLTSIHATTSRGFAYKLMRNSHINATLLLRRRNFLLGKYTSTTAEDRDPVQ